MRCESFVNNIKLKSRAKINLGIDVLKKRLDGYHEVKMVMQEIDFYDNIELVERRDGEEIQLYSHCPYIPKDDSNIAVRAAILIKEKFNIPWGLDIYLDKNIPVGAGLAGGSSNAAAVLRGLNHIWELNLSKEDLMEIGVQLGADVPFCIMGGAAIAEGIGEKLTAIQGLKNTWIVLVKPYISVSTVDVYRQLDLTKIKERPNIDGIVKAIKENNLYTLCSNMENVLETVTVMNYPIVSDLKKKMMGYQAIGSMMTGSGPTVFGIFKNYKQAKSAYNNLKIINRQTYMVQIYSKGNYHE